MSFLLHLDICSAFIRKVGLITNRFLQNLGKLQISAVTVMALELWLLRKRTPSRHLQGYGAMMRQLAVLNVDELIAHRAAVLGANLHSQGSRWAVVDLLVAATAVSHGSILVTHDIQQFSQIPGLNVVDWSVP
jgi:tRNA(fMet)-specific endonuclease VapC